MTPARAGLGEAGCRAARRREAAYRRGAGGAVDSRPQLASGRPRKTALGRGAGEGLFAGRQSPWFGVLARPTRDFVPRVSRETCMARQHRRQVRALSHYPCSSWLMRQASGFGPGLSCCAGFWTGAVARRSLALPQRRLRGRPPIGAAGGRSARVNGGRERGWVRAPTSVTGNLHSTTTPAPASEPCRTDHALHAELDRSRHSGRDCSAVQVRNRVRWRRAPSPSLAPFYRAARQPRSRGPKAPAG